MKQFEKDLRYLEKTISQDIGGIHQDDQELPEDRLQKLRAFGLIDLTPIGENKFWITLTDDGLVYFETRSQDRADFWKDKLIAFLSGVAVTLVTQCLIGLLR